VLLSRRFVSSYGFFLFIFALLQLAFLTIARCGFGLSLNYAAEDANVDQNQNTTNDMTVEKGFGVISETIVQRLAFPNWLYKLPIQQSVDILINTTFLLLFFFFPSFLVLILSPPHPFCFTSRIRKIDQAWKLLASFMHTSVQRRGEQLADDPKLLDESCDVFTRLVAANDEKAKYRLDTSEVVSHNFF